jgi:hypothetical protein
LSHFNFKIEPRDRAKKNQKKLNKLKKNQVLKNLKIILIFRRLQIIRANRMLNNNSSSNNNNNRRMTKNPNQKRNFNSRNRNIIQVLRINNKLLNNQNLK